MKKLFFLICTCIFFSCEDNDSGLVSFKGELAFAKTFGGSNDEFVKGVTRTMDGGFVVIGYTKSFDGDITDAVDNIEDAWVSKYNSKGELLWSKTYGGSADDYAYSAVENEDGSLTIVGYSLSSNGDVPSNLGMHDFFIFKITQSGDLIWSKSYGYSSHDHAHKIIKTSNGGYLVTGFTDYSGGIGSRNNLHGVGEYYALKLDASGEKEWDVYFGGTQNDRIYDMVEANDGGFVLAGYSESNDFDITDNHGSYDYWVVKINNVGELVWKKSYGGSEIDQAYGIVKTNNNTYLVAGVSNSLDFDISSNIGSSDVWVIHIDDNGTKLWDKSYGGASFDTANSIKTTNNGNFIIAGHSRSSNELLPNKGENDFYTFVISPGGQVLWQKTFGGSNFDLAYDAVQLLDNSFIIVGETQSNDFDIPQNKGNKDLFIVKVH